MTFVLLCLFLSLAPGCRDEVYSPFFKPPEPPQAYFPMAGLEVYAEDGVGLEEDCTTLLNRSDSVFLLEVQVDGPLPERLAESVRHRHGAHDLL